ncbi:MAG: glycosyltransferase family 4 protein [Holosporaceae bacterium]|jgi:glycosyltransferase involved in cell wall biosynthesis
MKLLFVVNTPEFFLSHRLPLAKAAKQQGYNVHVVTGMGAREACEQITALGFTHHLLPLSRSGRNPLAELASLWAMYRLMTRVRPDLLHLVTIKPVLYGGLIARLSSVPAVVAAISGMGTVFVDQKNRPSPLRLAIRGLYRLALGHPNIRVIFQNPDDKSTVMDLCALREEQTVLIKGSGVALAEYPMLPEPEGAPIVTLASRLLKDKGVLEFVEAARILKAKGVVARFWLIGNPDPGNITSVTDKDVEEWQQEGLIEPLGYRTDIAQLFAKSNIVVLPSYREGFPKVIIEAAACGRAVVTTDVPGCRHAIDPGKSGLLVPVRDAEALADAILSLIQDPVRRHQMGVASRALAEKEYNIEQVVMTHLEIYRNLSKNYSR